MTTNDKPAYSPGLAGVIAGESAICWVDPNAGLLYRGYDVHELAGTASFEEIVWLLLHGEMPEMAQLGAFTRRLSDERTLPAPVTDMLRLLPAGTHPMDALRTGVSMLAPFDKDLNDHSHESNLRRAVGLIAKVSTLIADGWCIQHGGRSMLRGPTTSRTPGVSSSPSMAFRQNSWQVEIFDTVLVLYAVTTSSTHPPLFRASPPPHFSDICRW